MQYDGFFGLFRGFNDLPEFKKTIINIIKQIQIKQQIELIESFIQDNSYLDFVVKTLENLR